MLQHKPTDGLGITASEIQPRAYRIKIQASEIAHWIKSEIANRSRR